MVFAVQKAVLALI